LIEHYAGAFLWLSPVQISIDYFRKTCRYCRRIADTLLAEGIRVDIDLENEKIGYKIRKAAVLKTPYMCIIGDNEMEKNTVNIRKRNGENIGEMTVEKLTAFLKDEISNRR
jgi:threonyl-tRNA synthetase